MAASPPSPKLFTAVFGISRGPADDWFDTILNTDTELFVDPFLVFKDQDPFWSTAHPCLIAHFNRAFMRLAMASRTDAIDYLKAIDMVTTKEPREFCLGYTALGSRGSGLGSKFAKRIGSAMRLAIDRGIRQVRHVEELAIFAEDVGADRISDMTCTILKPHFVRYTQQIAKRHKLDTRPHRLWASNYDLARDRWQHDTVSLPTNPFNDGPLLLVPMRFLRRLPTLNPDAWFDDMLINAQLRVDLSQEILTKSKKKAIIAAAKAHPDLVPKWSKKMEQSDPDPYPVSKDPDLRWRWSPITRDYATTNPLNLNRAVGNRGEFAQVIEKIIETFQHFVTDAGGWRLIWDGADPSHEIKAQLLFRGLAAAYCEVNDIALNPEVNLGRGPVDFAFDRGRKFSAMMEVKKLHHSQFWNGLEKQLPTYAKSAKTRDGWYLVLEYGATVKSRKIENNRLAKLAERVADASARWGLELRHAIVDCRKQRSASKL